MFWSLQKLNSAHKSNQKIHIEAQSGTAFTVKKEWLFRIIDLQGQQVSDLICFNSDNSKEYLSSGRSIDYNGKIYLTTGDILYSSESNPMLAIVEDRVGRHDFLFAPCSREMFRHTYGLDEPHPNCLDNLADNLKSFGIDRHQIPTAFNIFMNAEVSTDGSVDIKPPLSNAGDFITFRAKMDLIIGVTACSATKCNNYDCTPIEVQLFKSD